MFILSLPSIHMATLIVSESVSNHKDVPNVFFQDVYFLKVGACGSSFIGTLSFCNGCQTYWCRVKDGIILRICMISLVCESFLVCNSIKIGQAFFIVQFLVNVLSCM